MSKVPPPWTEPRRTVSKLHNALTKLRNALTKLRKCAGQAPGRAAAPVTRGGDRYGSFSVPKISSKARSNSSSAPTAAARTFGASPDLLRRRSRSCTSR